MIVKKARLFSSPIRMDERTFEAIFHQHYSKIYEILARLTREPHEADDLAAETFWRLWDRPPDQNENIAGWLYRVATRLGYNAMRGSLRRDRYESEAGRTALEKHSPVDPAEEVERRQEQENVRKILRNMPLRDVQLLVLRHSGLSYKEIAAALEISPSSIGTLLVRSEKHFEALYKRGEEDAPTR